MDLGLLYAALAQGQVDVVAGNSTDGLIAAMGLAVLEDDRRYFPPYEAAFVVRGPGLEGRAACARALERLSGAISAGRDAPDERRRRPRPPRAARTSRGSFSAPRGRSGRRMLGVTAITPSISGRFLLP